MRAHHDQHFDNGLRIPRSNDQAESLDPYSDRTKHDSVVAVFAMDMTQHIFLCQLAGATELTLSRENQRHKKAKLHFRGRSRSADRPCPPVSKRFDEMPAAPFTFNFSFLPLYLSLNLHLTTTRSRLPKRR